MLNILFALFTAYHLHGAAKAIAHENVGTRHKSWQHQNVLVVTVFSGPCTHSKRKFYLGMFLINS